MIKGEFKYFASCLPAKIWGLFKRSKNIEKIVYISEKEDWAIKNIGKVLKKNLNPQINLPMTISHYPEFQRNSIMHFGSQYMWTNYYKYLNSSNKYISTFFHGEKENSSEVEKHISNFIESQDRLSKVITSSKIVTDRITNYGIDNNKIVKIGLGVDTSIFRPGLDTSEIKKLLKIDKNKFVIGSFQKDGVGWGNGDIPKNIKGPDIFVKTLVNLKKMNVPVLALLLGPARGFVKNELKKNNIDFHHSYLKNFNELPLYYNLLDLYFISSREEGGPLGLLESLSCGIPVVSTPVGMSPEIINNKNGYISEINPDIICDKIYNFYKQERNKNLINICRNSIKEYDWNILTNIYYEKVYRPLLK